MRGVVGKDLTDEFVYQLGRGIGTFFRRHSVRRASIGRDARESSPIFRDLLIRGLNESGIDTIDCGMIATPVLYFTLFTEDVDGGVMITGSHNPADNNGFKICLGKSTIFGEQIFQIRDIIQAGKFESGSGKATTREVVAKYSDNIVSNVKLGKRKIKVVVDSGNGMGGIVAVPIYQRLGCEVIELFTEPDSAFPNHHPDPTVVENMRFAVDAVGKHKADLCIAFDGDADRIGVVDEAGRIIWGDQLMVIYSRSILKERPGATFISEVKASQTLFDDVRKHGGNAIMWRVGHSPIKAKMKETGAAMAGEVSGHQFFADRYFGFDDAIYAGARLLEILSNFDGPVSSLLDGLPKTVTTPEIRVECPDSIKFDLVSQLTEEFKKTNEVVDIDGARIKFEHGWGLVRASNTQPVLVLRFEADTDAHLKEIRDIVEGRAKQLIASQNH
ncbi:MAG: phosphomannomutase/phosphoglucomutase [Blastocatellia bacterium]